MEQSNYEFMLPAESDASIIKVMGVGGGGSNAVNHMFNLGIRDVDFIICNTDKQALLASPVQDRLQIGEKLTGGLGAGASPQRGEEAAKESREQIAQRLRENTRMLFVTAGMGGGTGTGAAPIIAQMAQEMGILTVGIVTMPFYWEGEKKRKRAEEGIKRMKEHCDTVLVVLNDKLREMYSEMSVQEAFAKANDVLTTAAKGIAEIITVPGDLNVDFEDINTVMKEAGGAVMGSSKASGEGRALRAVEEASKSPLLNEHCVYGARKLLLSIASGNDPEMSMEEMDVITDYVKSKVGEQADVIYGHSFDPELGNEISVTLIATGFEQGEKRSVFDNDPKRVYDLDSAEAREFIRSSIHREEIAEDFSKKERSTHEHEEAVAFSSGEESPKQEATNASDNESKHEWKVEKQLNVSFSENGEAKAEEIDEAVSIHREENSTDDALEELQGTAIPISRKHLLIADRKERVQRFSGIKHPNHFEKESFQQKLDRPAYLRRNVDLPELAPSVNRNLSRFYLDGEDKLMGKNRFLYDNVD